LTLLQNAEARGYYENKTKGDYVIRLKGPYDIALNKQADGTFGLTAVLWNGHVEKEVGQGYGNLLQLYGVYKATMEAKKKGLAASSSMRLLVVAGSPPVSSRTCSPNRSTAAQPPGPGFPSQAPSV
jgi:hypothetical protein